VIEKPIEIQQGKFLVRPYRSEDQRGVLSLWKAAFGKELSPRLFQWKYLENLYPVQIALALDEDARILVMYGGIPYTVNWKGKSVTMTHLMDIMSHPDCRGSGLFVKTGMAFFDLFAGPDRTCFYYGFPGKYHFDIGEKYLAYTGLEGGVRFLAAPTEALAHKSRALSGRIERVRDVDESFDGLWGGCRDYYPFAVIRNSAFLRWRFFEHPSRKYEVWFYRSYFKKDLKAYAVFTVEGETARMVDILAPCIEGTVEGFLGRVGHRFYKRGIKEIQTWLPRSHFLTQSLISAGFRDRQEPLGFIPTGRSFHPDISLGWASRNLFYTMADGDLL
jgi:hypothetical protein